jgi:hypothetical protein
MATMAEKLAMKIEDPANRHAFSIMDKASDNVCGRGTDGMGFGIVDIEYEEYDPNRPAQLGDDTHETFIFEDDSRLRLTFNQSRRTVHAHIEDFA